MMDSRDRDHRLLAVFLAGELDPAEALRWDEHLLACEACWRAVREDRAGRQAAQLLRRPPPPGLADRVAFAVEMAAAARTTGPQQVRPGIRSRSRARHHRRLRWRLAGAGIVAAGVVATLMVLLLPGSHQARSVPDAVAVVARYAQALPPPAGDQHPRHAPPAEVGRPVTVMAGGQRIVLRTWRLDGAEAVVAVSDHPFPRPSHARGVSGLGMAWSARVGRLGLYCLNGQTSELVAAPVPAAELAALAARLPLA
jgi:anti-sigma factor RsiW